MKYNVRVARTCVFCDEQANSNEHAFPAWLSEVVMREGQPMDHRRSGTEGFAWTTSGCFDFKVKQVCINCNTGWMSRLEAETKDLLIPLVLGTRTHDLTHVEQKRLGTWAYKTAIVLALITPPADRFVPIDHYHHLREAGSPPDDTCIWVAGVANTRRGETRTGWSQPERLDYTTADGPQDRHGYRLSFSIERVFFQVIWDAYGAKFERPKALRQIFTRIRPISKGHWPPSHSLTLDALDDLTSGRFLTSDS